MAEGLGKLNIMDGKHVTKMMRKLWITHDEKVKSAQPTQVTIDYAESYPQPFAYKLNNLTTFCHQSRPYNYKKQQLYSFRKSKET